MSVLPEKRRPHRVVAVAALLVATMWAILALYLAQAVGTTEWDGDCTAPQPTWAVLQAVVAFAGLTFLVRAALRAWGGARRSAKLFGFASLALVGWLISYYILGAGAEIVLCPGQPPNSI